MRRSVVFAILVLSFLGLASTATDSYWHAYDPARVEKADKDPSCHQYSSGQNASTLAAMTAEMKLWPNLQSQTVNSHSVMFGFTHGMKTLWHHQHPKDCSRATFFINGFHLGGFGSTLHVHAAALGIAMNLGRVYLQNPFTYDTEKWEWDTPFCRSQKPAKENLECYYEPWSSCTIYDALGPNALQILNTIHPERHLHTAPELFELNNDHISEIRSNDVHRIHRVIEEISSHRVVFFRSMPSLSHGVVPMAFDHLLQCSPLADYHYYYWWRALSIAFTVRPNEAVRSWLAAHTLPALETTAPYVSVYVRRGDKAVEMQLVPLQQFQDAIVWQFEKHVQSNNRTVFLSTEDSSVIDELSAWASHLEPKISIHYTQLFDRHGLIAELTTEQRHQHDHRGHTVSVQPHHASTAPKVLPSRISHRQLQETNNDNSNSYAYSGHHPEEYLSMILNVHYLVRAEAYVCTLASNFCRIVDELRATVAGRADRVFVDLSKETCGRNPPCVGNIENFDWRK